MSQSHGEAPSFSIMDVVRGMRRRKLLMLSCLILGILLGLGVIALFKPRYQAEARVLIDNFSTPYDSANVTQADRTDPQITERTIASQVAVLQSEDLAQRVIKNLSLTEKAEFDSIKSGIGTVKKVMIAAGFSDDPRKSLVQIRRIAGRILHAHHQWLSSRTLWQLFYVTGRCPQAPPCRRGQGAQLKEYFLSGKPRPVGAELHL